MKKNAHFFIFLKKKLTDSDGLLKILFPFLRKVGCALVSCAFPLVAGEGMGRNDLWVVKVAARFHRLA
ncbi:MAG: hypothetical protein LBK60_05990 [Verrucomicrobiales bacterium]|jgi:hypothetical protein|nr:hypothetical protein [Verrucomicrobiales bacterium]